MINKKKIIKTPSQTVGPFFGNYLKFNFKNTMFIKPSIKKNNIIINCNLKDRNNKIIKDGFIEYWQIKNTKEKNKVIKFNRINYNKLYKSIYLNLIQII